jgi:hypothetical protein
MLFALIIFFDDEGANISNLDKFYGWALEPLQQLMQDRINLSLGKK